MEKGENVWEGMCLQVKSRGLSKQRISVHLLRCAWYHSFFLGPKTCQTVQTNKAFRSPSGNEIKHMHSNDIVPFNQTHILRTYIIYTKHKSNAHPARSHVLTRLSFLLERLGKPPSCACRPVGLRLGKAACLHDDP